MHYRVAVSKRSREFGHPVTPNPAKMCSKRAFDGELVKWRRQLHEWDDYEGDWQWVVELSSDD